MSMLLRRMGVVPCKLRPLVALGSSSKITAPRGPLEVVGVLWVPFPFGRLLSS